MGVNNLTLDAAGEEFIKGFEGLSLKPYLDSRGKPTQGWGHTLGVTMNSPEISQDTAEALFLSDMKVAIDAVNEMAKVVLNQNEFNALVDFAFNLGIGALDSTLMQCLNRGDREDAAREFLRWKYFRNPETGQLEISPGLLNRRIREAGLFCPTCKLG